MHTQYSIVSLSSSLSNPRTTYIHKDNVCKGDCGVFFFEGDLFCMERGNTLLQRYSDEHKICQVEISKLQDAGVRGVSTTINSKLGHNGPAVSGGQGQTYTQFSCCSSTGKNLSKGSDSTPFCCGWGSLTLVMLPKQ